MTTDPRSGQAMEKSLLDAVESSDVEGASKLLARNLGEGVDPWRIHLSLFPVVQRVLNPPFINPHLPKMYRICGELAPHLPKGKVADLVALEVREYARRPKMERLRRTPPLTVPVAFTEIEKAIREDDPEKVAPLMAAFLDQKGGSEFSRRILLLGSGYLGQSLGHSLSCTAFILLEMIERSDQDPWPALSCLADYFCKGKFHVTRPLGKSTSLAENREQDRFMIRAASGGGIVNLHHSITRYAIDRVRHCLNKEEFDHMIGAWVDFMGNKKEEEVRFGGIDSEPAADYPLFYETFSKSDSKRVVTSLQRMIPSDDGRQKMARFLLEGLCDRYQGDYNPHYLTGLGSVLWVVDRYANQPAIALNALAQYLDFLFAGLKS